MYLLYSLKKLSIFPFQSNISFHTVCVSILPTYISFSDGGGHVSKGHIKLSKVEQLCLVQVMQQMKFAVWFLNQFSSLSPSLYCCLGNTWSQWPFWCLTELNISQVSKKETWELFSSSMEWRDLCSVFMYISVCTSFLVTTKMTCYSIKR